MADKKKLLEDKKITSGYLDFPAKLRVKYTGDSSYTLHYNY
mgnify:CR=1 FL=1